MATFTDNPAVPGSYLFKGSLDAEQMHDKVWVVMRAQAFIEGKPDVEVFIVPDKQLKAGPIFSPLADLLATPFVWNNGQYEVAM